MATYDATKGDTLEGATIDDIVINGYGESGRIVGETPRGTAWVILGDKYGIRRVAHKYSPDKVLN
jgi:hypothetical protein